MGIALKALARVFKGSAKRIARMRPGNTCRSSSPPLRSCGGANTRVVTNPRSTSACCARSMSWATPWEPRHRPCGGSFSSAPPSARSSQPNVGSRAPLSPRQRDAPNDEAGLLVPGQWHRVCERPASRQAHLGLGVAGGAAARPRVAARAAPALALPGLRFLSGWTSGPARSWRTGTAMPLYMQVLIAPFLPQGASRPALYLLHASLVGLQDSCARCLDGLNESGKSVAPQGFPQSFGSGKHNGMPKCHVCATNATYGNGSAKKSRTQGPAAFKSHKPTRPGE